MYKNIHLVEGYSINMGLSNLLALLFCFCCILLTTTATAETIRLNQDQFRESYTEEVNISGAVRTGVMYATSSKHAMPDSLYIDLGKGSDQILCVKMISVDGRYGADFEYSLTSNISGLTRFQLPTTFKDVVTGYSAEQIAVLAEIKPACKSKSIQILPASWGSPKPDTLKVFLNSGVDTTYLKLYLQKGGSKKQPCQAVKAERGTAYDTACSISDPGSYDLSKTKVIRKNFDNIFKPIKLRIYLTADHS